MFTSKKDLKTSWGIKAGLVCASIILLVGFYATSGDCSEFGCLGDDIFFMTIMFPMSVLWFAGFLDFTFAPKLAAILLQSFLVLLIVTIIGDIVQKIYNWSRKK